VLAKRRATAPEPWIRSAEKRTKASLAFEARLDREYAQLSSRARSAAGASSSRGDVRAIESLMSDVRRQDERLGRQRPDRIARLIDDLNGALEVARHNRLALDRWHYRVETFGWYQRFIDGTASRIAKRGQDFAAVRSLAGPTTRRLADADRDLAELEISMLPVAPPPDLKDTHDALLASVRLLREALRLRHGALAAGDITIAHNASAAAAGGWLLFNRVRANVADFFRRPSPR
jgi:hypothetical protein